MPDIVYGIRPRIETPFGVDETSQGRFFSTLPGSTPKIALNQGPRRSEFVETMARLVVDVPQTTLAAVQASLPAQTNAVSRTLFFAGDLTTIQQGDTLGTGYFDFLLTSASIARQEREQLVDTLTDNTVVYYSGESAPMLSCSGTFLNTYQDDQHVWFQMLYSDILRGSALARRGLIARFRFDSFYFSGYVVNLQTGIQGGVKNAVDFSFNFRVKRMQVATPLLSNPSRGRSLLSDVLFEQTRDTRTDYVVRVGLEAAEQPAAPLAVPAATSVEANVDSRAVAATVATPDRDQQQQRDLEIATQTEQRTAVEASIDETVRRMVDEVATPVTEGSGDVRQGLPAEESQRYQDFRTVPTPQAAPKDPLTRTELEIERQLRTASPQGTRLISPVSGAQERSGTYADGIARGQPLFAVQPPPRAARQAVNRPRPTSQEEQALDDVYNPSGPLLVELTRRTGEAQNVTQPRNRSRNTGAQGR